MPQARILVVDDDADIRGLVRELLERRGFAVAEAMDGRQALQQLYDDRPDLVVLDVGMPGMDGWTTLERIRELSNVPVVMLTARGEPVDLTPLEFRLLTAFVRHPNQVLSHEQLLELVWGDADASREQVKLYVGYLRRKLCPDAPDEAPIETRRGFGYAYRPRRS